MQSVTKLKVDPIITTSLEDSHTTNTTTHSTEIDEIISIPPNWLLNSGISMIALVTITIIALSYFIQYPDKLSSDAVMTSNNPPIEIISRTTGYIQFINHPDKDSIKEGDIIMHINNTTDIEDVEKLNNWILKYQEINNPVDYLSLSFPSSLELGSIQNTSSKLGLKYKEMCQFLKNANVFERIKYIKNEIQTIKQLNQSLKRENRVFEEANDLIKKNYERQKKLLDQGVISELDFESAKKEMLRKQSQSESITNQILQNQMTIQQKDLDIINMKDERQLSIISYRLLVDQYILQIKSQIDDWSQSYNINAPISGQLELAVGISEKKSVSVGQLVGYILPITNEKRYLSAIFPISNIGKINKDQKVLIKLDAYPFREYGMLVSYVGNISKLPKHRKDDQNAGYEVRIPIKEKIITDLGKSIPYKPNMTARVEVITENKSIFTRIFDQLINLMNGI